MRVFPIIWEQAKTVGAHTKKMCPCESPLIERTLEFRGTCQKSVPLPQNPYVERTFEALGAHREGQPRRYIYIYIFSFTLLTYSNPIPLFSTTTNSPQTFKPYLPLALCPTNYLFTTFLASSKRESPYEIRTLIVLKVLKVNICAVGHIPIFMLPYLPH